MKLKSIHYDDNQELASATVVIPIDELVAIGKVFGKMNGYANQKLGIPDSTIYDVIVGDIFNRHYENGIDHFGRSVDLATLNVSP
jgi:hypothetical protein